VEQAMVTSDKEARLEEGLRLVNVLDEFPGVEAHSSRPADAESGEWFVSFSLHDAGGVPSAAAWRSVGEIAVAFGGAFWLNDSNGSDPGRQSAPRHIRVGHVPVSAGRVE